MAQAKTSEDMTIVKPSNQLDQEKTLSTWDEYLAPAPMGIFIMSQLLICSTRVTDFAINRIDKDHIKLLKHPMSFRTTLVQIVNESYEAFMLAHTNMERICLRMAQIPDDVSECVELLQSENKNAIEKFSPRRLKRIKEAADGGEKLSEEVCQAFKQLKTLNEQTLEASSASMSSKEKTFTAKKEEEKKREKAAKEEKELQEEIEHAKRKERRNQSEYLDETRKGRKWGFWLELIGYESKDTSIEYARQMKQEAEEKLKQIKKEAEDRQKEIDRTYKENMDKLAKMGSDTNNAISQDQTIAILQESLQNLGQIQEQWHGITSYFNGIRNYLNEKTIKRLDDLRDNIDVVKEDSTLNEVLTEPAQLAVESSHKTHHSAKMYVTVSNKFIIKSINQMHGMLALPSSEVANAQEQLMDSCKEASEGIKKMYNEEQENKIREMTQIKNESEVKLKELEDA